MSHAVISPRDILSLQEEAQNMGRNFYSKPKVHRSATMTQRYIKPGVRRQLEQVEAMRSMVVGGVQ